LAKVLGHVELHTIFKKSDELKRHKDYPIGELAAQALTLDPNNAALFFGLPFRIVSPRNIIGTGFPMDPTKPDKNIVYSAPHMWGFWLDTASGDQNSPYHYFPEHKDLRVVDALICKA
jgi:hypothetical protein